VNSKCIFKTFALSLIWSIWLTGALWALSPSRTLSQYNVQIYNIEKGLPSNTIYAILQTKEGYLWIGTHDGLARFDGSQFQIFNRSTVPHLGSNVIRALHEDKEGTLWIGTDSGGLTYYKNGQFGTFNIDQHKSLSKINTINSDRQGNIWIGSFTEGLTKYGDNTFTTYTTQNGLPDNRVRHIYRDKEERLWIVTPTAILKLIEPGTFEVMASNKDFPFFKTTCLYRADEKELWIGSGNKGLYRLQEGRSKEYGKNEGIPHLTITSLYEDRGKNLWIGSDGGGLTRMRNGIFDTLPPGKKLLDGFVHCIYEDNEGSLWVGTLDAGLHQLRDITITTYTSKEGLLDDYAQVICKRQNGGAWIGTRNGVSEFSKGVVSLQLTTKDGLLDNIISSLYESPSGTLWIGTWVGLHEYKAGTITPITKKNGLSDNRIKCILGDNEGNTWVGTENGLNRIDGKNGTIKYVTTKEGLSSNSIITLFIDNNKTLWISTEKGLNRIIKGNITAVKPLAGLGSNIVQVMHEGKDGVLWFGTDRGLIHTSGTDTTLINFQTGLIENQVISILEDNDQNLWLSGRKGISRISKTDLDAFLNKRIQRLHPVWFDEKDGLKSRWTTNPACVMNDGKFMFPTSVGVSILDPNRQNQKERPIPLIIEKMEVDGVAINIHSDSKKNEPLKLGPGIKRLDFYYTGVNFTAPNKIRFKLKLEGYDNRWIAKENLRSTTYAALRPGLYTFHLDTAVADIREKTKGTSFTFYLKPYFYQTLWFYLTAFLIVSLGIFTAVRLRIRQLRLRAEELSTLVQLRTRDLEKRNIQLVKTHRELQESKDLIETKNHQLEEQSEQLKELNASKSRFFANVSHEFRTPLTLIIGPLEQILTEKPDKDLEHKAQLMLRNSRRLLTLVNQLLELAKFESGKMTLAAQPLEITGFIKNIVTCFEPMSNQKNIRLDFQEETIDTILYFDPEKLEKIVTNLISNAFNYTPEGGLIQVILRKSIAPPICTAGCLDIIVKDSGTGIPEKQLPYIFDRFFRGQESHDFSRKGTGIGLALTKELVELHRGEIDVRSDCSNSKMRGTEFTLRLPMGKEHLEPEEIIAATGAPKYHDDLLIQGYQTTGSEVTPTKEPDPKVDISGKNGKKSLVLVVDDNPEVKSYIRGALAPFFNIAEAANGDDGILKAKELIPDLVISDIMMPGTDGFKLCRTLKTDRHTSHIPVILLTAKVSEENILTGFETGADDYITKPFSTSVLLARVKNLIQLRDQLQHERKNQMIMQPQEIPVSPIDDSFFATLQETLKQHQMDPEFNVEALSLILKMSQATLYRKIHALTGQSPTKFIRSFRIKQAAQLLLNGIISVSEVAQKVGFIDRSYFAKCFKQQFHCLPSAFQAQENVTGNITIEIDTGTDTNDVFESEAIEKEKDVVLVVEDNEDSRKFIRNALEADYRVLEAQNGGDGITQAMRAIPDLIISDVMMPGTDGFELCRKLKKDLLTSHIPIILLTAKTSDESMIEGLETGADDYIIKPFNTQILRIRIKNLIQLRNHLQQRRMREMTLLPEKIEESEIDRTFIEEVKTIIEANLSEPELNVEQLAKKLYMSSATLFRKLQALTGENPSQFMRTYRIQRAAQMLCKGTGSITEIAFEVGFSSRAYFTKCFKEIFHQSPSAYKTAQSKKNL
jgi:DNA-binding response OmpR family regulator/signal transduction histidine kinase/ligand-binding sensor domain-containing protein